MKTSTAAAAALLAGCLAPADATALTRYISAGTVCHSANGGASAMFVRHPQSLAHVGTSDQYVLCDLSQEFNVTAVGNSFLAVEVYSTTAGRSVVCTAQSGSFSEGMTTTTRIVARSWTADAPGATSSLQWTDVDMNATGPWSVLVLSCRMSPGTRLGTIRHIYDSHN